MVLNGVLAGLVAITAEPLTPPSAMASLVGGVGGAIVVLTVPLLDKLKIDDVVGAIPVHLLAGIWGTLAVVLTNDEPTIGAQVYGIAVIASFVFISSTIVWFVIDKTIGLRVHRRDELRGLNDSELGMNAYPEFMQQ